jgi:hypothetical protein
MGDMKLELLDRHIKATAGGLRCASLSSCSEMPRDTEASRHLDIQAFAFRHNISRPQGISCLGSIPVVEIIMKWNAFD